MRIRLHLEWKYTKEANHLQIQILYKKWIMKEIQISISKQNEKQITMNKILDGINAIYELLEKIEINDKKRISILKSSSIHELNWKTVVGTGDAAHTGMLMGLLWPVKGMLLESIKKHIQVIDNEKFIIEPKFNAKQFETNLSCMMHIKLGQAMNVFTQMKRQQKSEKI